MLNLAWLTRPELPESWLLHLPRRLCIMLLDIMLCGMLLLPTLRAADTGGFIVRPLKRPRLKRP